MDIIEFRDDIKAILNHLSDVGFLETYDLANLILTEEETRQANWIQLLRAKISESIKTLNPPEGTPFTATEWRSSRILAMRYLNAMELYRIEEELGLSDRQVQREIKKGVDALISILWKKKQALEKGTAEVVDENKDEAADSDDLKVLSKELKNWEITFGHRNLTQIIEQAIYLCDFQFNSGLHERVHYDEIDRDLSVLVDPILTKQALYKILSMVITSMDDYAFRLQTRKLNTHFIDLTITVEHAQPLNQHNWQIARLFLIAQGLNYTINEQPDQTTISIHFPLMKQSKCLVIDDVRSVRALIERMLGPYGVQVFGADNPQEALSLAQLMVPNFILLDILMPQLDGWELIKSIKQNSETKDIPVIICSVLYEPELARAVGAAGYIRKPIDRLDLIKTLQKSNFINS